MLILRSGHAVEVQDRGQFTEAEMDHTHILHLQQYCIQ